MSKISSSSRELDRNPWKGSNEGLPGLCQVWCIQSAILSQYRHRQLVIGDWLCEHFEAYVPDPDRGRPDTAHDAVYGLSSAGVSLDLKVGLHG